MKSGKVEICAGNLEEIVLFKKSDKKSFHKNIFQLQINPFQFRIIKA